MAYNPLRAIPPKQLDKIARSYARAQFGPLLSQINASYARQAQGGNVAIGASTAALARGLGGAAAQTHGIYGQAQSAQTAIDQALAAHLAAAGQSAQSNVAGQLAAAGQAPPATNLGQIGAGAGAASFGQGSAALSRLVAEGAARENYAGGLPNIAKLGGAQRSRELALQLEHGRQGEVSSLQAKIPGVISQIEQDLANREFQKAAANLSYGGTIAGIQGQNQRSQASIQGQNQRERSREKAAAARTAAQQQGANYRAKQTSKRQGRTYSEGLSRSAGHAVDSHGRAIINPKTGSPYPYKPPAKSKKSKSSGPFG